MIAKMRNVLIPVHSMAACPGLEIRQPILSARSYLSLLVACSSAQQYQALPFVGTFCAQAKHSFAVLPD